MEVLASITWRPRLGAAADHGGAVVSPEGAALRGLNLGVLPVVGLLPELLLVLGLALLLVLLVVVGFALLVRHLDAHLLGHLLKHLFGLGPVGLLRLLACTSLWACPYWRWGCTLLPSPHYDISRGLPKISLEYSSSDS